jgi:hypothetical protein
MSFSPKKEEEKYCQENFNSDVEQFGKGFGIGVIKAVINLVIFLGILLIILIAKQVYDWFFDSNKIKINRITESANNLFREELKTCNNKINIVEANIPDPTTNCTCYYGKNESIRGCTDNMNTIYINDNYDFIAQYSTNVNK